MKTPAILFRRNPLFEICPSCGASEAMHRSHSRNSLEYILKNLSFFKIYRCGSCGWRGYRSTLTLTVKSLKNIFIYLVIAAAVAFIVIQILKKIL